MLFRLLTALATACVAYLWLTRIKQGPIYESSKLLDGKTVLITGGNAGIGKATVVELAKRRARVIMASRNVAKSEMSKNEVIKLTGHKEIVVMQLDLGNYDSIRTFVKRFIEQEEHLDFLVNNAGVFSLYGLNEDGINNVFSVNHLGPFLLTNLLLDKMKSQAPKRPVRIINLSSEAHRMGNISEANFKFKPESAFDLFLSYANSKLANVLFTTELNKRFKDQGITSYSVHPGHVRSEIDADLSWHVWPVFYIGKLIFGRDPFYGAQTILYCVLDDDVVQKSGGYFSNCAQTELAPKATGKQDAEELWERSLKLVGLT